MSPVPPIILVAFDDVPEEQVDTNEVLSIGYGADGTPIEHYETEIGVVGVEEQSIATADEKEARALSDSRIKQTRIPFIIDDRLAPIHLTGVSSNNSRIKTNLGKDANGVEKSSIKSRQRSVSLNFEMKSGTSPILVRCLICSTA